LAILAILLNNTERGQTKQLHGTIINGGILPKSMHQYGRLAIRRKVHARK
jgi:hypothetical protein